MQANILVPLDGSSLADVAVHRAAEIARRTAGRLHLVRVHRPFIPILAAEQMFFTPDPALDAELEESARSWLFRRAAMVRETTELSVTAEFKVGNPVDEISAVARNRNATAIVCTTHGAGGWAPRWLGSVTDGLIRHAGCPVLAMSEQAVAQPVAFGRILVLLDGSDLSSAILPVTRWIAHAFGSQLELLRVAEMPWMGADPIGIDTAGSDRFGLDDQAHRAKTQLDAVADGLRSEGFAVSSVVKVSHDAGRTILDHIAQVEPDIVTLSTHGRGLSRLLLGSVANKVLRAGGRPMLSVRPVGVAQGSGERLIADLAHTMI